ncbi:hypothetical protein [Paenibacillus cremeus]|uniref:Uncharacterized protein n=1 Tax=Paenibacillus cremeus TaxID=2163881 RepID=A0A559KF40_9BACL|nr:hypothetical protein [Paenibacillus cremeus]TVY10743.1 hypothetical protein FPZ49_06460 [Paenibacillus cremeus]
MKKRRSTVLVSPGKDVTLYIPTDTPPEVIEYMNRLKAEGIFSQGIMDILIQHIVSDSSYAVAPVKEEALHDVIGAVAWADDEDSISLSDDAMESQDDQDWMAETEESESRPKSFSLDEIFRQAGRNAGKLMDASVEEGTK